jgi:hypothetical protein
MEALSLMCAATRRFFAKRKRRQSSASLHPVCRLWEAFFRFQVHQNGGFIMFCRGNHRLSLQNFQDQNAATKTVSFGTTFSFRKEKVDVSLL